MPDALALLRAILAEQADQAEALLNEALEAEVDPLRWCSLNFGIDDVEVMRRVAHWADFAFFDTVPVSAVSIYAPSRLEGLAEARMIRLRVIDRDVVFVAPDFYSALRLKRMVDANPAIRRTLCIVPRQALRERLVALAQETLMANARQNLSRHWPLAVAQLDLTAATRWTALALLGALAVSLTAGPLGRQSWTVIIWIFLVVFPAALRLVALVTPGAREPEL